MSKQCKDCGVFVAGELRHCPLCGKFVANAQDAPATESESSYPKVDQSYTSVEKWIKKVRAIIVLLGIISVAIDLFFKTVIYWSPYVLIGLFALWRILFYPFKEGKSHVASIPTSGIIVAVLLIFIDVYNYLTQGAALGWALCYSAPAVLTGTTIIAFILAITNHKFEESLSKGLIILGILEVVFLISKLLWFNKFESWPIFMSLLASFISLFLLFVFKKKRLIKEFNRSFHI